MLVKYGSLGKFEKAQEEFDKVFVRKDMPTQIDEYVLPVSEISLADLIVRCELAPSKKAALRLVAQDAVKIDGNKIDTNRTINIDKEFILSVGKRKFKRIKPKKWTQEV